MKVTEILIEIGALGTVTKRLIQKFEDLENKGTSGDHPNNSVTEICQNTEKSHADLRRLAVIQTPVKNYLLTPVQKTLKRGKL